MIYASTATDKFKPEDIANILTKANHYNKSKDLTGMLCFSRNFFLQCIEGSRSNVNELYQKIASDKRHSDIVVLNYKEIDERAFSEWSMAYLPESKLTSTLVLKFSENSQLLPYNLSGESAHKLIMALRDDLDLVTKS